MAVLAGALCAASATVLAAPQASGPPAPSTVEGSAIDGPTPPVPPETITRDAAGKATVRALRLGEPLRLDGTLDEGVYGANPPFGGFIQVVPKAGAPSSERTDVWVMFDTTNMYVAARCWDSAPPEKWVANELRRDTAQLRQNDTFGVMFDTFYDRRSGFMFYTNPLGAVADYSVVDEGQSNTDWNPVWNVRTGRFDGGWTVEMAIPFKTLRYRSGPGQVWGIQLRRSIRRKNEWTYLTPVPASLAGPQALNRISAAGTLVGLDLPPASRNLELKPYAISRLTTDRVRNPPLLVDLDWDLGGDVKYGVTANLTADLTINTDFAQVEIDEQQVNLTRFNLFFPEKRDFFLEGRGIFDFARGGPSSGTMMTAATSDTPYLFYSRRIGLNRNRVVPIVAGGRLTGKAGRFAVGAMNIQTGEETVSATRPTNFTVLRVKRDVLRRSTIGAMATNRSVSTVGHSANQGYGVDGAFSFYQNVAMGGYYARTATPGLEGDPESYQGKLDYMADRYGARAEYLKIGDGFNPEVGFVRRADMRRSFASLRFSPRPASIKAVRKFTWEASLEYILNGAGSLETRQQSGRFNIELDSSDQFTVEANRNYELLIRPFEVGPVVVPTGGYNFNDVLVSYALGQQRRVSGTVSLQAGGFYDGTLTALSFTGGRVSITKRFSLEPSVIVNWVDLPVGDVTQELYRARTDYAFSARMFASALLQYNSTDNSFSSNLRFRWEYWPGSEFFFVWTDERDTLARGDAALRNRAFVAKITRLVRF
ncbi:MAG: DUF5916 domain-containing protein [Vicinamibacterales bacterium]